jgi:PAS domain S-box-containing protein
MEFSLSLTGKKIRRIFLVFFILSSILPLLLLLIIVNYYVLPIITSDQAFELKDVFSYGLLAMILIPIIGFFLMSKSVGSLESLAKGIKARLDLLTGPEKGPELENEIETLELVFNELEKTTRQLKLENTERQRAEEALRESEERYRGLMRNNPIGLYRNTLGPSGQFVMANPAIAGMFGYDSVEEFQEIKVSDLYADPKQRQEFSDKLIAQGKIISEERLKKKDGTPLWASVTTSVIRDDDGNIQYFDGSVEDITERKEAEEALKKSERVYRSFSQIGMALTVEKNINKLLEMIVRSARDLSNADAGTLYTLDDDEKHLRFEILQNDTLKVRLSRTSDTKVTLPNVPLYVNGKPNYSNVSSYVALTDKMVNIEDVYEVEGFDFTGPRKYDLETGYRSKSMLVVPMKNHENNIIGVLQLLNAQDPNSGEVIAFPSEQVDLIASLASQAAVALTNTRLIHDLDRLLNAFIKSIATTIDEKSPYTGGHIKRVVELTTMIAEKINQAENGPFKDIHFTPCELEELRMAAWMHDVGKIATPEHVVDKATKLVCIFDRIDLITLRFDLIEKHLENVFLQKKGGILRDGKDDRRVLETLEEEFEAAREALRDGLEFIRSVNGTGDFMPDDKVERIKGIGEEKYSSKGVEYPYLTTDEIENLSIRKGTLTDRERRMVEDHARLTTKILSQLPFPRNLSNVPKYAGEHHEKLDGSGYHKKIEGKDLPLQSRIIAFADIFEALTAKDRPYRKPMQLSQAIKILGFMKKDRHIDPDIHDFFLAEKLFLSYAEKEMTADQIDPL